MNLAEKQVQLTARLAALKHGQDRLASLVEQAKKLPALPPALRVEASLIPGCLAKLWFVPRCEVGLCTFVCDSNSLVVKAIAGLLCEFYSGHPPAEILAHPPEFLVPLGITQHLTPNRRNALGRIWERIRQFAGEHLTEAAPSPTSLCSLDDLLQVMNSDAAEELRLRVGSPPAVIFGGASHPIAGPALTPERMERLLQSVSGTRQRRELRDQGAVQFVYRYRQVTDFVVCARMENGNVLVDIH